MYKKTNLLCLFFIWVALSGTGAFAESKIPWDAQHFPNAPRITAEQALQWKSSGVKMVVIDAPWGQDSFNEKHVCGAVGTKYTAEVLDRLISKIPKDYLIIAYCR